MALRGNSRRWSREARLRVEPLESRTVLSGDPLTLSPYFEPAEPLAPVGLCPQPNAGIYYDPATQTLCIVGSEGDDRVSVTRVGGDLVAVLDTPSFHFEFTADSGLVARLNVDVRAGNDRVGIANDVLQPAAVLLGAGDDGLSSGGGGTRAWGGAGDDTMLGGPGAVLFVGNDGNDGLVGGRAGDRLFGSAGDDKLVGGEGDDVLVGGKGNDALAGDGGGDVMLGGVGNDVLLGGAGNDRIAGEEGDDYLEGGAGSDYLVGGAGADFIHAVDGEPDTVVYDIYDTLFVEGIDTLILG